MRKNIFSIIVAGIALSSIILINGCSKSDNTLSTVLKDLPENSYSLNFQDLGSDPILTKNTYGSMVAETMIDIDDICPPLVKIGYKKIPRIVVWPPTIINPPVIVKTCPTMVPIQYKDKVLDAIGKSTWQYAKGITSVKAGDYAVFMNTNLAKSYASIQPDSMDLQALQGINLDKVFLLPMMDNMGSFFKRSWYGQANLSESGITFKIIRDKFPPKQIGCLDPEQLTLIRENLVKLNPTQFEALKVQEISGVKGSTLTF